MSDHEVQSKPRGENVRGCFPRRLYYLSPPTAMFFISETKGSRDRYWLTLNHVPWVVTYNLCFPSNLNAYVLYPIPFLHVWLDWYYLCFIVGTTDSSLFFLSLLIVCLVWRFFVLLTCFCFAWRLFFFGIFKLKLVVVFVMTIYTFLLLIFSNNLSCMTLF